MIHARRYIFSRGPFFPCYMRNPRQHCVLIAIRLISRNSFLFNQPVPPPSPKIFVWFWREFLARRLERGTREKRRDGKRGRMVKEVVKKKKKKLVGERIRRIEAAEFSTFLSQSPMLRCNCSTCFVDRDVIGSKKFTALSMPFRGHVHDNVVEWQFHYWPATFSGEKSV